MKKIIIFIALIGIIVTMSGCVKGEIEISSNYREKAKSEIEANTKLIYYESIFTPGASDEKGYYFVKRREDGASNIKYINYESSSEIYLCNRIECQHSDDTCNSWRPYTSGQYEIYLDDGQLYIIHTGANEYQMNQNPQKAQGYISAMDLSGSNEKRVHIFENLEGSTYMSSAVFSEKSIYIVTQITQKSESSPKTDFYLTQIDKNSGNVNESLKLDLNNPSVIGVKNNKFIILDIDVKGDNGAEFTVYTLDIITKNIARKYAWDNNVCFGRVHDGEFYLFNRTTGMVSHVDIETGKETQIEKVSREESIIGISVIGFIEDSAIGATYNDDGTGQIYMINLKTKSVSHPNMLMETKFPELKGNIMLIVSSYKDKFIVANEINYELVDYPQENGKTIKMQTLQYKYGVIDKEDYINNTNTCTPLEMAN